jgi:tetratricopeptide (TPR) repeat protein
MSSISRLRSQRCNGWAAWTARRYVDRGARAGLRWCRWPLLLVGALLIPGPQRGFGDEANSRPARLTVAVMEFHSETNGTAVAPHWGYAVAGLLRASLAEVKALRVLSGESQFAALNIKVGDPIGEEEARKIGEFQEARRVIFGSYRRDKEEWSARVKVLTVGSRIVSREIVATAKDPYDLRDELVRRVLAELRVVATGAEQRACDRRATQSLVALEWFWKAMGAREEGRPMPELEAYLRKALDADPTFAEAVNFQAVVVADQGRFQDAEQASRRALELRPGVSHFHTTLGQILLLRDDLKGAERELREGLRLDSEAPAILSALGLCTLRQDRHSEAIELWKEAKRFAPAAADVPAHLGHAYATSGRREAALIEFAEADRLGPEDINAQQFIWQGYLELHDIPLAAQHLETVVRLARAQGIRPEFADQLAQAGQRLRTRFTIEEIPARMPAVFTEADLSDALHGRLTAAELPLALNPLLSTPEMDRWARELTAGTTDDLGKAKKLFEALVRQLRNGVADVRTAREVHAAWNDPTQAFSCQDYAKLYVALARAVGLKAFYVHLEKDYRGEYVYHDCAAIFTAEKALLVDPAYLWFGVPHREYLILNDLQTVAHQMFQHSVSKDAVVRSRAAIKLDPLSAWGQTKLAAACIDADDLISARKALTAALELEPNRWDASFLEGMIALKSSRPPEAIGLFRRALEVNPKHGAAHLFLGEALSAEGRWQEARDELRLALSFELMPAQEQAVLKAISWVNELLDGK